MSRRALQSRLCPCRVHQYLIEFTVKRENIGGSMLHKRIGAIGYDIHCVIINDINTGEIHEYALEIFALLKSIKSKFDIFGGHFST